MKRRSTQSVWRVAHSLNKQSKREYSVKPLKGGVLGSSVYVWGSLSGSSLGLGPDGDADRATPTLLPKIDSSGFRDISVGPNHTMVVTGNGELFTFGRSVSGQLGLKEEIPSTVSRLAGSIAGSDTAGGYLAKSPEKVEIDGEIIQVSAGPKHSAAVTADGSLYTWGYAGPRLGTARGLGHPDKTSVSEPRKVEALADELILNVSCGERHTICATVNGDVFAFGDGNHGKLGTGKTTQELLPRKLEFFNPTFGIWRVECAKEYSFALDSNGVPFGWGRNDRNQLGQGAGIAMDMYSCDTVPSAVAIEEITDISLSQGDVLVVDSEGWVYSWGDRLFLEPTAINEERFQDEKPIGKVDKVAVGSGFMAFATDRGELFSCSKKSGIQSEVFVLGQGAVEPFKIARRVTALRDEFVTKMAATDNRMAVIVK